MPRKPKPLPPGCPSPGQAFRCADGIIRWIAWESTRGRFHVLWTRDPAPNGNDAERVWWRGDILKPEAWMRYYADAESCDLAPQPGTRYRRADVFGGWFEVYIPLPDESQESINENSRNMAQISAMALARGDAPMIL